MDHALTGGCPVNALEDLTGGFLENITLKGDAPKDRFGIMVHAKECCSLMECDTDVHTVLFVGLITSLFLHCDEESFRLFFLLTISWRHVPT